MVAGNVNNCNVVCTHVKKATSATTAEKQSAYMAYAVRLPWFSPAATRLTHNEAFSRQPLMLMPLSYVQRVIV